MEALGTNTAPSPFTPLVAARGPQARRNCRHGAIGGPADAAGTLLSTICGRDTVGGCIGGVAVNTASLLVIQSRSSLFMKSVVIVRNVGLVLWGVLVHAEAVTLLEAGGYGITLACFAWCASEPPPFPTDPA